MGPMSSDKMPGMEMCKEMMERFNRVTQNMEKHFGQSTVLSSYATPEVRALFEDWSEEIEKEILTTLKEKNAADLRQLAEQMGVSENSIFFFLSSLAQKEKITIKRVEVDVAQEQ